MRKNSVILKKTSVLAADTTLKPAKLENVEVLVVLSTIYSKRGNSV